MKILMVGLASLMLMSGCASGALGKLVTPNSVLISQIAIDAAVGAVCGPETVAGVTKALAIKTAATELLALDNGSAIPLTDIYPVLNARLDKLVTTLNPAEMQAAKELLLMLSQTANNVVQRQQAAQGTSTVPIVNNSKNTIVIATALHQVINATAAYGV